MTSKQQSTSFVMQTNHSCTVDCAHNILEGNIPLGVKEKKRLGKYKEELRALRKKNTSDRKKKQILQEGGSCLLYWLLF